MIRLVEREASAAKNVFVIGLDEFNLQHHLRPLAELDNLVIHPLLSYDEVKAVERYDVEGSVQRAREQLRSFPGSIDAIVGYWDFPVSLMVPLLCKEVGLPAPSLESVCKCEHKYWSRLEQSRAVRECPRFGKVDPFDQDGFSKVTLDFPFWLKPVKSFLAQLAFKVESAADFHHAISELREKIGRFAAPCDYFFKQVKVPEEMAGVHGGYCVVEEMIGGKQCTLEGYAWRGRISSYGIVDITCYPGSSVLLSLDYPSTIPHSARMRMGEVAAMVMSAIGFDNGPFNIEFFWDERSGQIRILEINARISKSHAPLFRLVDGMPNHKVMLDVALGREPRMPQRQGTFRFAKKFMLRKFEDGFVIRVPSREEVDEACRALPGTSIIIYAKEQAVLSSLLDQDSYSYNIADIFIGGRDEADVDARHQKCLEMLHFEIEPVSAKAMA
jgi:hypothetical protein